MISWLASAVLITVGSVLSLDLKADRDDTQMCQEVQAELQIQVDAGMRSQESADATAQRCFDLFT